MSILLIQCLLGLSTIPFSAQYPDGSEMMKLVGWAQSIVTFRGGSSEMLSGVAFVFRVHLVLGMTIFLLFPFTRLVHVWSAPFEYFPVATRLFVPAANSLCPGIRLPGKEKRLGVVIRQRTGYDDSSVKGEHQ